MENTIEFIYTAKEVSARIGIATSTLRTWCLKLESSGYIFKRTDDGKRTFFEHDIAALRAMKELSDKKHPIEYAVEQVMIRFHTMTHSVTSDDAEGTIQTPPSSERFPNTTEFIQEIRLAIREEVHQEIKHTIREEIRQEVTAAIEEQNKRLEEHIDRRDRQLVKVLHELREQRKRKWWRKLF